MFTPTHQQVEMWKRGWSCTRLAQLAGVSRHTMQRGMASLGMDLMRRPNPIIEKAISESKRLRSEGHAMRDIADIVGFSRRQIQRWLNPKNTAP